MRKRFFIGTCLVGEEIDIQNLDLVVMVDYKPNIAGYIQAASRLREVGVCWSLYTKGSRGSDIYSGCISDKIARFYGVRSEGHFGCCDTFTRCHEAGLKLYRGITEGFLRSDGNDSVDDASGFDIPTAEYSVTALIPTQRDSNVLIQTEGNPEQVIGNQRDSLIHSEQDNIPVRNILNDLEYDSLDESTFFNYVAEGNVPTVENTTDTQAIIIVSSPVVESTSVIFSPSIENHGFDSNGYVVHDNDPNNTYLNDCPLCGVVSAEATHRTVSNSGCDAAYDSVGNARDNLVDNISNASSPVFDTDSGLYDSDILNLSDVSVPQRKRPSRSSMVSSVSNKR